MNEAGDMDDFVYLTAEIAYQAFEAGKLTREQLFNTLEGCINVIAIENGYADRLGLPFPDHKFDNSDVVLVESENEKETE